LESRRQIARKIPPRNAHDSREHTLQVIAGIRRQLRVIVVPNNQFQSAKSGDFVLFRQQLITVGNPGFWNLGKSLPAPMAKDYGAAPAQALHLNRLNHIRYSFSDE
jgi:hypothetical protein